MWFVSFLSCCYFLRVYSIFEFGINWCIQCDTNFSVVNTWAIYVFAYMARFEMQISKIVKNCALIELANFAWSVLISLVFIISFIICFFVPVAFAVVPAYYVLICDLILARVFRKYMSKEDLEQELLWMETEDL